MAVSQAADTEELMTCLRIQIYHPPGFSHHLYDLLPMNRRQTQDAEDPVRVGRDGQACKFLLNDLRVSRKQLALQAFRAPGDPELRFTAQNLSQRGRVTVNGTALGYLEATELPDKALLRFGFYELLVLREPGDAKAKFDVLFQRRDASPSLEMGQGEGSGTPVMESGLPGLFKSPSQEPSETDEAEQISAD
ncbi:TRAF-interacting protein with FHA domain-containing protein A [Denticeps clupeoides]|uniref:TRAF-interacting protein with FHA domain-containing protein A n=1 Tax=Denticeps clupeoides TaxID=299321 RepID=UPI0010A2F092|nr:TRAF-interacting protein with FHA domain-containing protein A-like [Denticeps clupeoides]